MKTWKLVVGIALLFILGVLAGSLTTKFYLEHQYPYPRLRDPKARKTFFMEKLSKELDLTREQKIKIGEVVEQIEAKRREYSLQRQADIDKLIDQMKRDLNDNQQRKFDAMREKFKKRQRTRMESESGQYAK